ncbi:hypothetical protein DV735_g5448, partial [Chaetothyriales sp. CBS 134920]
MSGVPAKRPFSTSVIPRPTKSYHETTYPRLADQHGFEGHGKTVLVTGGASGVGYEISKAFASTTIARLIIVSRNPEQQARVRAEFQRFFPSVETVGYIASITDTEDMVSILAQNATPDVLVLNAAIAHRRVEATALSPEEVDEAFETNVLSTFNIVQAYLNLPSPPRSGRRTIINVSSGAAHAQVPFRAAYGPSKAAAAQILQAFAAQFHDSDRVKIYSYHPGTFYTAGVAKDVARDRMVWEDIRLPAHFALWLAGPQSDFLHGKFLWANWDVDELIGLRHRILGDSGFLTIGLIL